MNDRALAILEFHTIKEKLQQRAGSAPGRALCDALSPMTDTWEIRRALNETGDAITRLLKKGSVSFSAVTDLSGTVKGLSIGARLEAGALLRLASFLENVGRVKRFDGDEKGTPVTDALSDYFAALSPLTELSAEIRRIVLSEDEIAPDASPKLKSLKREQLQMNERIRDTLNKMVNGPLKDYLQDNIVTMRGDRFCLPVKSEHKGRVSGIVHDQSASGSTFFIEPAAVVEMNNRLKELALEEQAEIERILAALCAEASVHTDAISDNYRYMAHLDYVFAKGALALDMQAVIPEINEAHRFVIRKGRHPLIDKDAVVPIDVSLGGDTTLLVITGPNTGGKTVTLKTVGLLTAMALSGLAVPAAERTTLPVVREIFADIGDEQSITQSLSTFSGHMTNTVDILAKADADCLLLFDEPGAGTDPTEGAALATAILDHLKQKQILTLATTHYAELKVYALTTKGVLNASCEFDVKTLRPTYRLLIGTPGKSNAFAISKKLGLPEGIISDAASRVDKDARRMEDLFADLEESRVLIEKERGESLRLRKEAESLKEQLKKSKQGAAAERDDLLAAARQEAEEILSAAKTEADAEIRALRKAMERGDVNDMERARTRLNEKKAARAAQKTEKKHVADGKKLDPATLLIGEDVEILSMGLKGTVSTKPDKDGYLFVQCGILRTKAHIDDLLRVEDTSVREVAEKFSVRKAFRDKEAGIGNYGKKGTLVKGKSGVLASELHLIGKTVDEALPALDKYLDDAYLSHAESVRIVHGKGTGALRDAIHRHLKTVRYVKSYSPGAFGEGDSGVTIVTFK